MKTNKSIPVFSLFHSKNRAFSLLGILVAFAPLHAMEQTHSISLYAIEVFSDQLAASSRPGSSLQITTPSRPETPAAAQKSENADKPTKNGRGRPKNRYLTKKCTTCGKSFASAHLLAGHALLKHTKTKRLEHKCNHPDCGYSSNNLHNLLRHRDRVHGEHNLKNKKTDTKKEAQSKTVITTVTLNSPHVNAELEQGPHENTYMRKNPSLHDLWEQSDSEQNAHGTNKPENSPNERNLADEPDIPQGFKD
ncbi:C2H2-type zinc finger protein, partial [Methylicorpusculum sp.]|uniref:C2H2-type zinc finger protein n=1 Tax=Methylicorpusculum sp. TaxID=2713644 RepID=UPI002AB911A6